MTEEGRAGIHGRLLDHLLDGAMVVERGGTITVLNPAAARILGVSLEEVAEKTFAELFIAREGFEEFSDVVLDAVAGEGEGGRKVVALGIGDAARTLSVAISYIRSNGPGAGETAALIAVFSDITELRELRETELRMAKAVAAQHAELQTAYRRIEERNDALAAMLKKVQVARVLATVVVIGVFLGVGAHVWQPLDLFASAFGPSVAPRADAGVANGLRTIVVELQPLRETIALVGKVAPWRTVALTSPIESRVLAVHFQYGQKRVVCGRGRNTTISEPAGPCGRLELDFAPQTAAYAAVGPVRRPRCQRPKGTFRPCSRRVAFGSPPRQILHSTPNQRNPARRSGHRDAYRSISPSPANDPKEAARDRARKCPPANGYVPLCRARARLVPYHHAPHRAGAVRQGAGPP